ncbi:MAG TPA: hypothetical protein VJZ71_04190 [Phycisphaerae bacterium]|nr:hypothetical protein [Phycisphaerae bacterium]
MIIAVAIATGSGCGASNIRVADEPTFSKLAGRWSIPWREVERAVSEGQDSSGTSPQWWANERVVFVTIEPDGMIDWSRSLMTSPYGLHGLRNAGDTCGAFRLTAAEYTPTQTRVRIQRGGADGATSSPDDEAFINLELQGDGSALMDCGGFYAPLSSLRLTRHDRRRYRVDNTSRLAGKWSLSPDDPRAVLVVREDGTFDWSGTLESAFQGLGQIEYEGDRVFTMSAVLQLREARYLPAVSSIVIEIVRKGEDSLYYKLSAKSIENERIKVSAAIDFPTNETVSGTRTLYRIHGGDGRYDSVFSTLLREEIQRKQSPVTEGWDEVWK